MLESIYFIHTPWIEVALSPRNGGETFDRGLRSARDSNLCTSDANSHARALVTIPPPLLSTPVFDA